MSRHKASCRGSIVTSYEQRKMSGECEMVSTVIEIEPDESSELIEECNSILDDKNCLQALIPSSAEDSQQSNGYYKLKNCGRLTGPIAILVFLAIVFLILGREYLIQILTWLEHLKLIPSICVFVALFTIISFPFGFGYIILNVAAGYLYGLVRGQVVVSLSVAIGFTIAFFVCRCCLRNWAMQYVSQSTTLLAMKRIVEGPHGLRVIVFTRFTPIPFGLQNTLFAVSLDINYF